ncbi:FRG domain-containing protein [Veronia pacifica]|uniref:FRG domain-containing protein n=1 Tax=Veronia pacifica TaxID=1080227 RepID=A0A1C3EFX6_9GAMM|nr:FRG domain-containing protein [Veronia pacifica]ODA32155.1 hypothetical protein A8L45_13910 [Veronia pacifica]
MQGQWFGAVSGTNDGEIILNIDDRDDSFTGLVHYEDKDNSMPSLMAYIDIMRFDDYRCIFDITDILAVHPVTKTVDSWDSIKSYHDNEMFIPNEVVVIVERIDKNTISIKMTTDIGTEVSGFLNSINCGKDSSLTPLNYSWDEFKRHALDFSDGTIFRGQNQQWKLETGFNRQGRYDLVNYRNKCIPELHRQLTTDTKYQFKLADNKDFGAFLNLAQHHGFPTPLLDWTYSPYVAAFFAFRGITSKDAKDNPERKVRIFMLNRTLLETYHVGLDSLIVNCFNLAVVDLLGTENPRMIPQQATATISNVADIEKFIKKLEQKHDISVLQCIDIPWSERDKVVRELTLMGLTAGSLFPGIDGTCEALKEKLFA